MTANIVHLDREAIKHGLRDGSMVIVDVREPHEFAGAIFRVRLPTRCHPSIRGRFRRTSGWSSPVRRVFAPFEPSNWRRPLASTCTSTIRAASRIGRKPASRSSRPPGSQKFVRSRGCGSNGFCALLGRFREARRAISPLRTRGHYMKRTFIIVSVLTLGLTAAIAQSNVVEQRQDLMKQFGAQTRTISGMLRGQTPFDLAQAKAALKTVSDGAKKLPPLFPESTKGVEKTEALPTIWENKAEFEKLFASLDCSVPESACRHYRRGLVQGPDTRRLAELRHLPQDLSQGVTIRHPSCGRLSAARHSVRWTNA